MSEETGNLPVDVGGRDTIYTPEIERELLDRLKDGQSLSMICRDKKMPHRKTVLDWVRDDTPEGFRYRYTVARETGVWSMFDDMIDIADMSGDARLRVNLRQWIMSKMLPKTFGDKAAVTNNVNVVLRRPPNAA